MVNKQSVVLVSWLTLLFGGCGGDEMSLTEYVERINAVAESAGQTATELFTDAAQVTDFTPQILASGLERGLREIRVPLQEGVDGIEPPEQVAEIHFFMWDWHARFISIEEALAARAGTTEDTEEGWEALSESPEMAAYRDAIAEGRQVCNEFQAKLDATAERGVFSDVPWLPSELTEVVVAALGCEWFPENPQDVYRYPPPTITP